MYINSRENPSIMHPETPIRVSDSVKQFRQPLEPPDQQSVSVAPSCQACGGCWMFENSSKGECCRLGSLRGLFPCDWRIPLQFWRRSYYGTTATISPFLNTSLIITLHSSLSRVCLTAASCESQRTVFLADAPFLLGPLTRSHLGTPPSLTHNASTPKPLKFLQVSN